MLVVEPFLQARTAKSVQTIQDGQWCVEYFSAYGTDELFLETEQAAGGTASSIANAGHTWFRLTWRGPMMGDA